MNKGCTIFIVIIVLICLLGGLVTNIIETYNDTTYTITITDKERVNDGETSKYLIFGKDPNGETMVFENTDTLMRGKFNSSTIYGNLEIGKTYEITVIGFRVPILSWYQNIISYSEKS